MFVFKKNASSGNFKSYNGSPTRNFSVKKSIKVSEKVTKVYSPLNIISLNNTPRKKFIFPSVPLKASISKSTFLKKPKKPLAPFNSKFHMKNSFPTETFEISIDTKTKKPSIMQTIAKFKQKVENKYSTLFYEIVTQERKTIGINDILNYIRIKKLNRDLKITPWQSNHEMIHNEMHLARFLMEIFDLELDSVVNFEEFMAVCSVHEIYFFDSHLNLFNIANLIKLKEKINNLKDNFSKYTKEHFIDIENLFKILNSFSRIYDRKSFCSYAVTTKLTFQEYLRALPIFLNLENSNL